MSIKKNVFKKEGKKAHQYYENYPAKVISFKMISKRVGNKIVDVPTIKIKKRNLNHYRNFKAIYSSNSCKKKFLDSVLEQDDDDSSFSSTQMDIKINNNITKNIEKKELDSSMDNLLNSCQNTIDQLTNEYSILELEIIDLQKKRDALLLELSNNNNNNNKNK